MWWGCLPLPKPKASKGSGSDNESGSMEVESDSSDDGIPLTLPIPSAQRHGGRTFDVNPDAESETIVFFPELESEPQL